MNIARPAGGFNIKLAPPVEAHLAQTVAAHPEVGKRWQNVIDRLKYTAHKEGVAVTGNAGERAGVFNSGGSRFLLAWRVLGSTVTVLKADF